MRMYNFRPHQSVRLFLQRVKEFIQQYKKENRCGNGLPVRNTHGTTCTENRRLFPRLAAFTLIELMVVIVILGILAAFVVPRITKRPEDARVTKAKIEISNLEQALELYYLDNGDYPTTEQGLEALVQKPTTGDEPQHWRDGGYLAKSKLPKDPWGNDYVYVAPGVHNKDFDLSSLGKDGQEGGEGYDADITNWD